MNVLPTTLLLLTSISFTSLGIQNSSGTQEVVQKRVGTLESNALRKVEPQYPTNAKSARVQGEVKVEVVIDEKGNVISAKVVSGDPLLHDPSLIAARQWTFKPALISGKPVKVSGFLTFRFVLDDKEANKDESTVSRDAKQDLVEGLNKQSQRLKEGGKVEEALGKFHEALSINPDLAMANYNLGMVYVRIKRFNDAETSCTLAVNIRRKELLREGRGERDRFVLDSLFCVGLAQASLQKIDDAIGTFKKFIEIEKRSPDAWAMLGNLLRKKGDHEAAIIALKKSLAYKPTPPTLKFIGDIYLSLNRLEEAIDSFKRCIDLEDGPHVPYAHFSLGIAYLKIGDKQSAMAAYNAIKKINNEMAEKLLILINK